MANLDRRQLLQGLGLSTAGLLVPHRDARAAVSLQPLAHLVEKIRESSREQTFEVLAAAIRAGAGREEILGAAFSAGVLDIRPRSVGGKLHAVMMVESAFQLTETAPSERDAWLSALWAVDDFKRSQERDRRAGDWVLPPRPEAADLSAAAAQAELVAALEAWDAERADRALVALLPWVDRHQLFEILWPYAVRCYVDLGHKVIFATQVERVLARFSWNDAEPALRSLVNGLLYVPAGGSPELESYHLAQERLPTFPTPRRPSREDPEQSLALLRQLRTASCGEAQDLVLRAVQDGVAPNSIWDGLRLYASELFHRRPREAARRHAPVHPVTEINAFAYIYRTSHNQSTRGLALLQAAGWLPLLRADLEQFLGPLQGPTLEAFGEPSEDPVPDLAEIFQAPDPRAAGLHLQTPTRDAASSYLASINQHLAHRAFQSHHYKFAAAIQEESRLANPRWAVHLLAPSITYLPTAVDPETETYRRSLFALERSGIA